MGAGESGHIIIQYFINKAILNIEPDKMKDKIASYSYNENGVFEGLRKTLGLDNLIESGVVKLEVSSSAWKDPSHLIDKDWREFWYSRDEKNTSLTIEFLCCDLLMTGYTLKTYKGLDDGGHMQSWVLEASNDGVNWEILDEHRYDKSLNNKNREVVFQVVANKPFRIFKITQTQRNTFRKLRYNMILRGIEFYGTTSFLS